MVALLAGAETEDAGYRSPPMNLEAEQALLGAILANNAAFEKVSDFLFPQHFADPVHARIFEACGKLIERGRPEFTAGLQELVRTQQAAVARALDERQGGEA